MKTRNLAVTPVKKYAQPKYPTQKAIGREPDLLRKLPSQWEKNAVIVAAVGMLGAMALFSCGILKPASPGGSIDPAELLNVAPIFVHGEGTGGIGCVMIVPPVFLSEREALAIIENEAESGGLPFGDRPPGYTATQNQVEARDGWSLWEGGVVLGDGKVGLDLYNGSRNVAAAYIPMEAAEEKYLPDKDGNMMGSSVTSYRPRELAELAAKDFAGQKGDISVGVFYEPGLHWEIHESLYSEYWRKRDESERIYESDGDNEGRNQRSAEIEREYEREVKALIEEDLRAQVRDFLEWLQGQGII